MPAAIRLEGLDDVRSMLLALGGELKTASDAAQTRMAIQVWGAEKLQMVADMDRPTPFTLGSILYKKAGIPAANGPLVDGAAVFFITPFGAVSGLEETEWLGVQALSGTTAGPRGSENALVARGFIPSGTIWVPAAEAPRDMYGNVTGISTMLTELISPYSSAWKTYAPIGPVGDAVGVVKKVGSKWKPYIWFASPKKYRERFDFRGRATREVEYGWKAIWDAEIARALERMALP